MKIKFKRDTSFRKQFFVPDSFSHPAKMDAQLLIWIVERYTEVSETILDPMAGSGTMMLACTMGRDVILVDLEEKFCKMMRDNWGLVKMRPQLGSTMGTCQIIQGDARQLEGLVDKIVTSPPYAEAHDKDPGGITKTNRKDLLPYSYLKEGNPDNIQNLSYGEIDKCIFSPPYEGSIIDGNENFEGMRHLGTINKGNIEQKRKQLREYQFGKETTAYGQINHIITSPPYEGSVDVSDSKQDARAERLKRAGYDPKKYQGGKGRNLQQDWSYHPVDSIITSPPYEGSISNPSDKPEYSGAGGLIQPRYYAKTNENIGNLKSQSYLEAMLQVYQQCFSVLKDNGLMILVTKNFIRNKQVIRLDTDTIKLCEQAGFSFVERHERILPSQSFWRVIYHQKFPDVEQILSEDILVFRR